MEKVLDTVNNMLNTYYKMNSQVGNEKQTSLKQIQTIMNEKYSSLCDTWFPKYAEECPSIDKCYKEEFPSFASAMIKKEITPVIDYEQEAKEIETLDVPQKRL